MSGISYDATSVERRNGAARIARRVGWGVADQGISSLSNFVLGILLAHSLSPTDFGGFSVAFVAFAFILNVVRGPSTDPLVVRFSRPPDQAWRRAVASAAGTSLVGGIMAGAGCIVIGLLLPDNVGTAFIALGVGMPAITVQDSYRFAFFSCGQPRRAFLNDLLWGVLQVSALVTLLALHHIDGAIALLVFSGSAAVSALVAMRQSRVAPAPRRTRAWLVEQRSLGGRYLVENLSVGAARQIRISAVGVVAGLAAVGDIRAAEILMGPFIALMSGVSQVSVPEARHVLEADPRRLTRFCFRLASTQAIGAAVWCGIAFVALPLGLGQLLLGDIWHPTEQLLPPMMIVLVVGCYQNAATAGVRALGASKRSMATQLRNAVILVTLGTAGAFLGGAAGACWGLAAATTIGVVQWWYQLHHGLADHLATIDGAPAASRRLVSLRRTRAQRATPSSGGHGRPELHNVQALRGIAAVIVVAAHVSGVGGIEQRLYGHSWIPWSNLPANTGVDLFFPISGLIMVVTTWSTFGSLMASPAFLWRRLTRIFPLYWIMNTAVVVLFFASPSSESWATGSSSPGIWQSYLLLPRAGRMPLLVAWTLAYELYFYLLFAVAIALGRRYLGWMIAGWAAVTLSLHFALNGTQNPWLVIVSSPLCVEFALGAGIGYAALRGWLFAPRALLAVGVAGVAALWVYLGTRDWTDFHDGMFRLLGPGVAMATVLYATLGLEIRRHVVLPRWLQSLGDSSYSLYLVHVPALTMLRFVLARYAPSTPLVHLVVLLFIPVYVIVASRLVYRLLERPLLRAVHRLGRRSSATSTTPAPAAPQTPGVSVDGYHRLAIPKPIQGGEPDAVGNLSS